MSEPEPELHVTKQSAYVMASNDLLMDMGVIPDTRPPPPPVPRRRRLRWWWLEARERVARRAFKLIAGFDAPGDED